MRIAASLKKGIKLIEQAITCCGGKTTCMAGISTGSKGAYASASGRSAVLRRKSLGNKQLQPTAIPYARYTIFICFANIELADGKG